MTTRTHLVSSIIVSLILGIVIGGYLFSRTQPRSFLAVHACESHCWQINDLAGLVAAVGIQHFHEIVPSIVAETDTILVIKHPRPVAKYHYVIIPKKDIKNIGQLSENDTQYLYDAYAVAQSLIEKEKLKNYRIVTNGPGYQQVTYLHFHLIADETE